MTDSFNDYLPSNISDQQRSLISQFKDLSGFDEVKSYQILEANDWNFPIALNLVLDGAYNEFSFMDNNSNNSNSAGPTDNIIRHRNIPSSSSTSGSSIKMNNSDSNNRSNNHTAINDDNQGFHLTLWNTTAWIIKLPFIFVIKALNTIYSFFTSMFYPTLKYDSNGTVERFISEFKNKYGEIHPPFFNGSYSNAVEEGKRSIRFVLIYIHSSSFYDIDNFTSSIIINREFIDLINTENLIFWACSLDYPEGYKAFQSLKASTYPFFALIGLKNNKMIVMKKIEGAQTLESVISKLKSAVDNNVYSLILARMERQERDMATMIRAQQDAAFEESLRADQEKERKKREEKQQKEQEEKKEEQRKRAETERQAKIAEMKKTLLNQISDEPDISDELSLRIMFKLPNGSCLKRRFLLTDPVKYLYYFVFCSEEKLINFKLRTNFPKCDIPGYSPTPDKQYSDDEEMNIPLKDLTNLSTNIVLFVHDLDS